jgi:hypothetical protein
MQVDVAALETVIRTRPAKLSVWFAAGLLLVCGGQLELWQQLVGCAGQLTGGQAGHVGRLMALASGPVNLQAGELVEWILCEELPQEKLTNKHL